MVFAPSHDDIHWGEVISLVLALPESVVAASPRDQLVFKRDGNQTMTPAVRSSTP